MNKIPPVPSTFVPRAAQQLNGLEAAAQALRRKAPAEAERALIGVLALAPGNADALRLLGVSQHLRGDYAGAVATLRQAQAARPDDALIHNNLGSALRGSGDFDGALAAFRRATELAPTLKAAWYNLGKTLKSNSFPAEARIAFEHALRCDPDYAQARIPLGDVLKATGDIDGAVACYRACLNARPQAPRAWFHLANLKTVRFTTEDVARLHSLARDPTLDDDERVLVGYSLSKALEDQHDYQAAFAALSDANRIKRRRLSWDALAFSAKMAQIDAAFSRPVVGVDDTDFGREVIFIVSLPRSGSTLTEQILAAHPQVEGANELPDLHAVIRDESKRRDSEFPLWVPQATPADWRRLGEDYMQRSARWRRDRPRFTDKGLSNWQLIGAAAAMLPGARFVNCRRDPLETCLSCFRQLFAKGNNFTYDLQEVGAYWRDYDRLSHVWRERYPEYVFDQIYEDLLADPEAQVRRLTQFLDLPYDPACLEFHRAKRVVRTASAAQVRQPLRRDTARASRYGSALDPLRQALHGSAALPA